MPAWAACANRHQRQAYRSRDSGVFVIINSHMGLKLMVCSFLEQFPEPGPRRHWVALSENCAAQGLNPQLPNMRGTDVEPVKRTVSRSSHSGSGACDQVERYEHPYQPQTNNARTNRPRKCRPLQQGGFDAALRMQTDDTLLPLWTPGKNRRGPCQTQDQKHMTRPWPKYLVSLRGRSRPPSRP